MEDKFLQQLKRGILEMLVLQLICEKATYGYELLTSLSKRSDGLFSLKEGTLYPILYRLEDDGMITASWSQGKGRVAPKKIYTSTPAGREESLRRQLIWKHFVSVVHLMISEVDPDESAK